jgi:hypothetical protein
MPLALESVSVRDPLGPLTVQYDWDDWQVCVCVNVCVYVKERV